MAVRDELRLPLRQVLGGRTAAALARLGLDTVGDLLTYFPRRYHQRGELTPLRELRDDEHATIFAEILSVRERRLSGRRRMYDVVVTDGDEKLKLRFFNLTNWQLEKLAVGGRGFFSGKVTRFKGERQIVHPEMEFVDPDTDPAFAGAIIPVYPAAEHISSGMIWRAVRHVLDTLDISEDPLPADIRRRHNLVTLRRALENMHRPADLADVATGRRRFTFQEAFVFQLALGLRRRMMQAAQAVPRPRRPGGLLDAFDAALPFALTEGQRRAGADIEADLAAPHPMHRLLHGEVGSGKTLVALRAMLTVVDAGGQAALLAPTEVLAMQHYQTITRLLGPLALAGQLGGAETATRVALITGSITGGARRELLDAIAAGEVGIVVGTHALLYDTVRFADLGLVVVDEQHRFGVEQRAALRTKGSDGTVPHVLVMTATPIPRTVALTVYGDLDISVLRERPSGDPKVDTFVVPLSEKPAWAERVWARVREEAAAGRQVYVICPRISTGEDDTGDESDDIVVPAEPADNGRLPEPVGVGRPPRVRRAAAVDEVAANLRDGPLRGLRIGTLHGRMDAAAKDAVLADFSAGRLDVLVATTVVEVGVDVPNASMMVILDADRFGVSQLHQLRGRIGRAGQRAVCLLVTEAPADTAAYARLTGVAATCDGFRLAELDLEQRGEGTVRDVVQHGRSDFRFLSLLRHRDVIETARAEAEQLIAADPELTQHPGLANAVAPLLADDRLRYVDIA